MNLDTIFFDFFGTLVAYRESRGAGEYPETLSWLESRGIRLDDASFHKAWEATSGRVEGEAARTHQEYSIQHLAAEFLKDLGQDATDALVDGFVAYFMAEWSSDIIYLDGVEGMLGRLAKTFHVGIITNTNTTGHVRGHMERMAIDPHISTFVSSIDLGTRKPSPIIFQHAIEAAGASPENALYVGDNPVADFKGATGAGLHAVLIDPDGAHAVPQNSKIETILDVENWLTERGLL